MPRPSWQDRGSTDTFLPAAARTVSGAGGPVNVYSATQLKLQLQVTAASGTTPTMDVFIEDTIDGVTWNHLGQFARESGGLGQQILTITNPFTNLLRVRHAIAGVSPSFTFSVIGYSQ